MWAKLFRLHKYDTGWLESAAQTVIELNKWGQVYKFRWRYEKSDANRNKQDISALESNAWPINLFCFIGECAHVFIIS